VFGVHHANLCITRTDTVSRNARPCVMHGQSTKTNTIYKAIKPHTIAIIIILFSVKFYTP
jgi:hypothetical protein